MAAPKVPDNRIREAVELVETYLKAGHERYPRSGEGAVKAAGREAVKRGWFANADQMFHYLRHAKDRLDLEPDWDIYQPARYTQPVPRAVLYPAQPLPAHAPSGEPQRILAVGDLHQDPRHPDRLEILTWIARFASEQRYDRIIQVGDWSTFDSVNQHDDNSTEAARYKPKIRDDLDNLVASHQAFRRGISEDYRPRLTFLGGNHENRLERFENANPEAVGTYTLSRDETFAQFGWRTRPYGELFYVEGVGFTHHPVNGAGRAFGGKTGPQRAANESTVPVVSGHTHRRQVHDSPKIGPVDSISMVEIGCAMPWGSVESYAKHSLTGWWWGVVPLTVQGGVITDLNFVSMLTLRARFSDDGANVRAA